MARVSPMSGAQCRSYYHRDSAFTFAFLLPGPSFWGEFPINRSSRVIVTVTGTGTGTRTNLLSIT